MPHSFTKNHLHIIFGTKERRKLIPEPMLPRVWAYMAGICRNHDIFPVIVGGMRDHAHVLIDLPARIDLAKAVNLIKTNSSKWMGEQGIDFSWQEGYAAFGVSVSNVPAVIRYIKNQEIHHRKMSFKEEYLVFLKKHGVWNSIHGMCLGSGVAPFQGLLRLSNAYPPLPRWANLGSRLSGAQSPKHERRPFGRLR